MENDSTRLAGAFLETARNAAESAGEQGIVWICISIGSLLPIFWLCSLIIPELEARLLRSLQLLAGWILGLTFTGAATITGVLLSHRYQSGGLYFASLVVGSIGGVSALFLTPLASYKCTLGQAMAFVFLASSLFAAGQWTAASRLGWPFKTRIKQGIQQKIHSVRSSAIPPPSSHTVSDETLMADRTKPLSKRREAADRFAKYLEAQRRSQAPGVESPELQRSEKRYRELLRILQADAQSLPER
jgi:hypothetical protein